MYPIFAHKIVGGVFGDRTWGSCGKKFIAVPPVAGRACSPIRTDAMKYDL
jgi:hypothetical protein